MADRYLNFPTLVDREAGAGGGPRRPVPATLKHEPTDGRGTSAAPVGVLAELEHLLLECEAYMRADVAVWTLAITYDEIKVFAREAGGRTAFKADLELLDCPPAFATEVLLAENPTTELNPACRKEETLELLSGAEGLLDRVMIVQNTSSIFGFTAESTFALACRRFPGLAVGMKVPAKRVEGRSGPLGWTVQDAGREVHTAMTAMSVAPGPVSGTRVSLLYIAARFVHDFLPKYISRQLLGRVLAMVCLRATRLLARRLAAAGPLLAEPGVNPSAEEIFFGVLGVPEAERSAASVDSSPDLPASPETPSPPPPAEAPAGAPSRAGRAGREGQTVRAAFPGILHPSRLARYGEALRASLDISLHLERLSLGTEISRLRSRAGLAQPRRRSLHCLRPLPRDAPREGPEAAEAPAEQGGPSEAAAGEGESPSEGEAGPPWAQPAPAPEPPPARGPRQRGAPPSNAYVLFSREMRSRVDGECRGWSSREKATRMGEMWRTLSEEERRRYARRAADLRLAAGVEGAPRAPEGKPRQRKRGASAGPARPERWGAGPQAPAASPAPAGPDAAGRPFAGAPAGVAGAWWATAGGFLPIAPAGPAGGGGPR